MSFTDVVKRVESWFGAIPRELQQSVIAHIFIMVAAKVGVALVPALDKAAIDAVNQGITELSPEAAPIVDPALDVGIQSAGDAIGATLNTLVQQNSVAPPTST